MTEDQINTLLFMHIPKCGGTTFHQILEREYDTNQIFDLHVVGRTQLNTKEFINLPQSKKREIRLLKGHMQFGLHRQFNQSTSYITFLRDPIERIVSYYYYVKRMPNHRLRQKKLFSDDMSLYDFVTQSTSPDINNGQARFIGGKKIETEQLLGRAIKNIDEHFSFVGTVELFDESLLLLQKKYGWGMPYYTIKNKTRSRPPASDLDEQTLAAIKQYNVLDI